MTFQEDFAEFLDVEQGFAVRAKLMLPSGGSRKLKGIFSNDFYEADIGATGIAGSKPVFECSGRDLGNAECGDLLEVNDTGYRIIGLKPDLHGWTVLLLEKQDY